MAEDYNAERELIFHMINRERDAQDSQWGGAAHDDSHEAFDWCTYITKQNAKAATEFYSAEFRMRMVKIAALAIAAIEASCRKTGGTNG